MTKEQQLMIDSATKSQKSVKYPQDKSQLYPKMLFMQWKKEWLGLMHSGVYLKTRTKQCLQNQFIPRIHHQQRKRIAAIIDILKKEEKKCVFIHYTENNGKKVR